MILDPEQLPSVITAPASILYGLGVRTWTRLHRWKVLRSSRLEQPVISVGNITVGGTGKTPIVACLGRHLLRKGCKVSILSRGYRRQSRGILAVSRGDGPLVGPYRCGDEPYLLALNLTSAWVTVAEDREAAGAQVEEELGDCIHLLDDGYQHLRLERDLNVLLLDATDPFGGERLLPWGRLREPISEIARADLIAVTRADHPFDERTLTRRIKKTNLRAPILFAYHDVQGLVDIQSGETLAPRDFFRRKVLAYTSVAQPDVFFSDLTRHQIEVVKMLTFMDHHRYSQEDVSKLNRTARSCGVDALVTTEKDAVNMSGLELEEVPIYYLRIEAKFSEDSQLDFYLEELLG